MLKEMSALMGCDEHQGERAWITDTNIRWQVGRRRGRRYHCSLAVSWNHHNASTNVRRPSSGRLYPLGEHGRPDEHHEQHRPAGAPCIEAAADGTGAD
jgi:hypothetical protein